MPEEDDFSGRDLHPSYVQDLVDCPPVVVSRFLFRNYAFLVAWLALASVFGIAIKYCMFLLFDETDTDYDMPSFFRWISLSMLLLTIFFLGMACYFRNSFPANGRCLVGVVMSGGYTLGVTAAEIKSRAFLNSIVVVCLIYSAAAILTQQTYFDFRDRKPYVWLAGIAAGVTVIVNLVHSPTSFGQFLLGVIGSLLMAVPVIFRNWQILPIARTDEDIAYTVDSYCITFGTTLVYYIIGKILGQTHPL